MNNSSDEEDTPIEVLKESIKELKLNNETPPTDTVMTKAKSTTDSKNLSSELSNSPLK
jgi:hypothetical protein